MSKIFVCGGSWGGGGGGGGGGGVIFAWTLCVCVWGGGIAELECFTVVDLLEQFIDENFVQRINVFSPF